MRAAAAFRSLLESTHVAAAVLGLDDGLIVEISPAYAALLGRPRAELIGHTFAEFTHPDEELSYAETRDSVIADGGVRFEKRYLRPNGETVWADVCGVTAPDESGRTTYGIAFAQEITAAKVAQDDLRSAHRLLEATVSSLEEAILVVEQPSRRILACNAAFERASGRTAAEIVGGGTEFLHPTRESFERLGPRIQEAIGRGEGFRGEWEFVRKDGTPWIADITATPISDDEGRRIGNVSAMRDVTEARRREVELRASEERYRSLVENATEAIVVIDADTGRVVDVNGNAVAFFGRSREDLFASERGSFGPPIQPDGRPTKEIAWDLLRRAAAGEVVTEEVLFYNARRELVPCDVRMVRLPSPDRVLIRLAVTDISLRKQTEEALRESEERLRTIFETAHVAIATVTLDGCFITGNPAFQELLGYDDEELRGRDFMDLTHPDDVEGSWAARAVLAERGYVRWEKRYIRKDGEPVWADVSVATVRDASGEPRFKISIANDLTERKALEAQLRQSQKLEAVGRLAGGVAHDFNNLLTAIIGYASLMLARAETPREVRREAAEISHAAERAAMITRQLLAFSRRQVLYPRVLDLNDVVTRTISMLERLIGEDVQVERVLAPDLRAIRVDPGQLEQVVLNLVLNARDAMPAGGRLSIETRNSDDDHVELVVRDTGVGMDAETRDRIFEPFFTTKEGTGNGLGLATVYGIVEQSGGAIAVATAPGDGAAFHVRFPAVDDVPAGQIVPPAAPGGVETVLLVEDEVVLRRLAHRVLTQHGYTVLEAGDGHEALAVVEETDGPIDLVLTDVVMPNLSGPELGERMSSLRPEAKVVYMSGYTDADGSSAAIDRGAEFIAKPFTPSALIAKLRAVLDG